MQKFIADLICRLFLEKNPKFFDYIQIIAVLLSILSEVIHQLTAAHIAVYPWVAAMGNSVVFVSGIVAAIIAELPNADKPLPPSQNQISNN